MTEPIEEAYFNWLCAKVLDNRNIYIDLLRLLHSTEFVWVVHGDHNRGADGVELREDFIRESRFASEFEWEQAGCSIFEMLLAFAKRAAFQTSEPVKNWFWEFMTNLGLSELRNLSEEDVIFVQEVLEHLIWRSYEPNGYGGMFPLRWPKRDQREVEIWYQFCEYVDEQGRI